MAPYENCLNGPAAHIVEKLEWESLARLVDVRPEERLLEVGCGHGRHIELFRKRGLDVIGLESEADLVESARQRLNNRHLVQTGQPEELPFEDNTFDTVILTRVLNRCLSPDAVLAEAGRVANRRVVIEVINPWSLLGLRLRLGGAESIRNWFGPQALRHLILRTLGPCPMMTESLLTFPQSWLPRLKNVEESAFLRSRNLGGLIFVAVDIRYTVRTRPLRAQVGLKGARPRRSVTLKPLSRSRRDACAGRTGR